MLQLGKISEIMEEILIGNKIDYYKAVGEAAIYGPKMDLVSKDLSAGVGKFPRFQLDFIMPERFGLKYTDSDGTAKHR